jgi:hypothetical protein
MSHNTVGRSQRTNALEPSSLDVRRFWGAPIDLQFVDRLLGVKDLAEWPLYFRGDAWHNFSYGPAKMLLRREAVDLCKEVVAVDISEVGIENGQTHRREVKYRHEIHKFRGGFVDGLT